jgi:hypothetical protein
MISSRERKIHPAKHDQEQWCNGSAAGLRLMVGSMARVDEAAAVFPILPQSLMQSCVPTLSSCKRGGIGRTECVMCHVGLEVGIMRWCLAMERFGIKRREGQSTVRCCLGLVRLPVVSLAVSIGTEAVRAVGSSGTWASCGDGRLWRACCGLAVSTRDCDMVNRRFLRICVSAIRKIELRGQGV